MPGSSAAGGRPSPDSTVVVGLVLSLSLRLLFGDSGSLGDSGTGAGILSSLSDTLSAAVAILVYPSSTLSLPSGLFMSSASMRTRHTWLCPFLVEPPSCNTLQAPHPGVYPCLEKSAASRRARLAPRPGSATGASRSSGASTSGGGRTAARRSSGSTPGVGSQGVPRIASTPSVFHLSGSGLRRTDLHLTTPLGVPMLTSSVR